MVPSGPRSPFQERDLVQESTNITPGQCYVQDARFMDTPKTDVPVKVPPAGNVATLTTKLLLVQQKKLNVATAIKIMQREVFHVKFNNTEREIIRLQTDDRISRSEAMRIVR